MNSWPERIGWLLEKRVPSERDAESAWLSGEGRQPDYCMS